MNLATEREVDTEGNLRESAGGEDRAPGLCVALALGQQSRKYINSRDRISTYLTYPTSANYVCGVKIRDQMKGKM